MRHALAATALVGTLLAGCVAQQPTLYHWGGYQAMVYQAYRDPGNMPPERQVELMEKDYQAARAANQRMPPGWHAQLGVLYFKLGRVDAATGELNAEKAEFPESAVFIDRLLANIGSKP